MGIISFLLQVASNSLNYILDTVPAEHALEPFLGLLSLNGKYVVVGLPEAPYKLHAGTLIYGKYVCEIYIYIYIGQYKK